MTGDTRADATTVRWEPVGREPRRVVFEPRADGRLERVVEAWTGEEWRFVGREVCETVAVEQRA